MNLESLTPADALIWSIVAAGSLALVALVVIAAVAWAQRGER